MTFEKQGPHNTEAALKLAIEAAREEGSIPSTAWR